MNRALILVLLVLLAQYGYRLPALARGEHVDGPVVMITLYNGAMVKERSWLYYILQAVQDVALWSYLLVTFKGQKRLVWAIGTAACAFGVFNSFETAVCATAALGHNFAVPLGDRLCTARFGNWFSPALAVLAVAVLSLRRKTNGRTKH